MHQCAQIRSLPLSIVFVLTLFLAARAFSEEVQVVVRDTGLVCAVDMGSNTFKFIVAEIRNGKYSQYMDIRKTVGVGDDLRASQEASGHKIISDGKIEEIKSLLTDFQNGCEQKTHSRKMYAIATAAFREAENINIVSQEIRKQGIQMETLSGNEEAEYAYEAATLGEAGVAVVDLGSRSTEFVIKTGSRYQSVELPTGYKLAWDDYYEKAATFSLATTEHRNNLRQLIGEKEKTLLLRQRDLVAVESGETCSYVLGIPQDQIEDKMVSQEQIQKKLKELFELNPKNFDDLKRKFKNSVKVFPRLVFLDFILEQTGYKKFRCTDSELNVAVVYRLSRGAFNPAP